MKDDPPKASRVIFGLFVAAQLLVPLGNASGFQRQYRYPLSMVGCHVLLVGLAYLALFGSAALLAAPQGGRWRGAAGGLLSLGWGSLTVVLYFGYVLAWGGRRGTGINLTPSMLTPYLKPPFLAIGILHVSPVLFWSVLAGIPSVILLAYAAAWSVFSKVLGRLGSRRTQDDLPPLSLLRPYRFAAGGIALSLAGFAMLSASPTPASVGRLFGDPILDTLIYENATLPIDHPSTASDAARLSYAPPRAFQRRNVVLIVLDACRADHLGVMGYDRDTTPFLSSLRDAGTLRVVRSFYSASCCTFGGILSLLRSQDWFKMSPRAFALPDALKRSGYRVHFLLSGDHSQFLHMKTFYGQSLDTFSDGSDPARHYSLNDDRGVFESLNGVPTFDGTPSFFYFHLMSSHGLGTKLAVNLKFQPVGDPTVFQDRINSYDDGIYQADRNIRELFHRLEGKGYLQNSVVFITGDHGDSLGERNVWGHSRNLYAEEVTPPLLIYDPDRTITYRNLELARQIDVAPTILDRLGLPIPSSWDGRSLLHDDPPRFSYLRFADTYAIIDHNAAGTFKYIYDDRTKKEEIYYLGADPHEHTDIFSEIVPTEVQELRRAVGTFSVYPGSSSLGQPLPEERRQAPGL